MSTFYVVATPIGNKQDLSPRAKEVLESVDIIACEDTRVTKPLLESFGIYTSLVSYHAQSGNHKETYICDLLEKGRDVALVSDAGTPTISDPGTKLVARVHESVPDTNVVVIPGPSAGVALLSGSGIPTHPHVFYGFLPHKKGRQKLLDEVVANTYTSVLYESPHRFAKLLGELIERGAGERLVAVGRELTKMYEEIQRGTLADIQSHYLENENTIKGEFVIAFQGKK